MPPQFLREILEAVVIPVKRTRDPYSTEPYKSNKPEISTRVHKPGVGSKWRAVKGYHSDDSVQKEQAGHQKEVEHQKEEEVQSDADLSSTPTLVDEEVDTRPDVLIEGPLATHEAHIDTPNAREPDLVDLEGPEEAFPMDLGMDHVTPKQTIRDTDHTVAAASSKESVSDVECLEVDVDDLIFVKQITKSKEQRSIVHPNSPPATSRSMPPMKDMGSIGERPLEFSKAIPKDWTQNDLSLIVQRLLHNVDYKSLGKLLDRAPEEVEKKISELTVIFMQKPNKRRSGGSGRRTAAPLSNLSDRAYGAGSDTEEGRIEKRPRVGRPRIHGKGIRR